MSTYQHRLDVVAIDSRRLVGEVILDDLARPAFAHVGDGEVRRENEVVAAATLKSTSKNGGERERVARVCDAQELVDE